MLGLDLGLGLGLGLGARGEGQGWCEGEGAYLDLRSSEMPFHFSASSLVSSPKPVG